MPPVHRQETMGRAVPKNLITLFTSALAAFQSSKTTFRILCSLPTQNGVVAPAPHAPPPAAAVRNLLVLDSSFNPPTLAHQRMVLSALKQDRYHASRGTRILLLLAINNADKAPQPAVFPHRLAMMYVFALDLLSSARGLGAADPAVLPEVDIAVTTEPYFHSKSRAVAESEFYGGGSEGAGASGIEQVYLAGFDTLIRIFNPKYYPDDSMRLALNPFFGRSRLLITMRTDADWGDAAEQVAYFESLRKGKLEEVGGSVEWAEKVEILESLDEVISSTKVRDAVKKEDWEGLGKLVSDGVTQWIREEKLYRDSKS